MDRKKKAETVYQNWLNKEKERRQKQKLEELKLQKEAKKEKQKEKEKKLQQIIIMEQKKKELLVSFKVRNLNDRKGYGYANGGKIYQYFDWSTSPDPSFVNKKEWIL